MARFQNRRPPGGGGGDGPPRLGLVVGEVAKQAFDPKTGACIYDELAEREKEYRKTGRPPVSFLEKHEDQCMAMKTGICTCTGSDWLLKSNWACPVLSPLAGMSCARPFVMVLMGAVFLIWRDMAMKHEWWIRANDAYEEFLEIANFLGGPYAEQTRARNELQSHVHHEFRNATDTCPAHRRKMKVRRNGNYLL
jgi:hypothetical protein